MPVALCLTLLCAAAPPAPSASDAAAIRITADDDPVRVVVRRALPAAVASTLPEGAVAEAVGRRYLTLALVDERTDRAETPMFGTYERRDGELTFRPRFGLVRECRYRAAAFGVDGGAARVIATAEYAVPPLKSEPPTVVTAFAPTGDRLPANVLKFYVWFSRPMREGREVHERIRLFDAAGHEIGAPWRDIELWNDDATRLTLFIHPGRIKQGVNLREELGPVLRPGEKYALVVGADLRDARGAALGREFRREFTAGEEVRSRVDVAQWNLTEPRTGSREQLVVAFDRPLDSQMARRCLHVRNAAGRSVGGTVRVADDQRSAAFTPADAWRAERYVLDVEPQLEDLSGNTPARVFDDDLAARSVDVLPPVLRREFTPR